MANASFKIVGIGASAGGVEALTAFFNAMPPESGLAFIVAFHLSPDKKSLLPEILARATEMPVLTAKDGTPVEPGHVYVIPPGAIATLSAGAIHLRRLSPEERLQGVAIDTFFDSLAADCRERAIGIILSGTGHDGALGTKAIREAGGLTIAQGTDGSFPQYPAMPESAVATGAVELILPIEEMPAILQAFQETGQHPAPDQQLEEARHRICDILRDRIGHDFSQYKDKTFMRRVRRRMLICGIGGIEAYIECLRGDADEAMLLFRDLLIGVTSFFRDPATFDLLARDILPGLFAGKTGSDRVRVWVAGCATGEEAYSIAILLQEYAAGRPDTPAIHVFATDMDDLAIAAARAGRYPASLVQEISPQRLQRFFVKTESGYSVAKEIRDICTFSAHSLIRDPPFSRIDFISCRNVLIYLDSDLQALVIPIFHYALALGGTLLLGSSESVSRFEHLFTTLNKKHRLFRRNDVPAALPQLPFNTQDVGGRARQASRAAAEAEAEESNAQAIARAKNRMLENYSAAFVVVTATGEILHYSSHTGRFFEPASGPPSRNLFDMARANVRLGLRNLLRRAIDAAQRVEQTLPDTSGETGGTITLIAEPLTPSGQNALYLLVFLEAPRPADLSRFASLSDEEMRVATTLERENRELREQLQFLKEEHETALEELRSANEELHSVNEELQSSNEELETSREEIGSINEEMSTVNAELSSKLEELDHANSDLRNLFESTRVATIFLDRNLQIRAFTPESATVYNLIPSDIGRPLHHIVNRLNYHSLAEDVGTVLANLVPLERRIASSDEEAHYLMRILPYRAPDGSVGGSLITFLDVTSIVAAEAHQRMLVDELNHRVKNMLTVVISLATRTMRRAATKEDFSEIFLGRIHALTKAYELLSGSSWEDVLLGDVLKEELNPFISEHRANVTLDGPAVPLDARGALAVGMAVHELCTNAAKYGALSVPEGDVRVTWSVDDTDAGPCLVLDWVERNGPPVTPPNKSGFGLSLIERGLAHDLGGTAKVEFLPHGVHAWLRAPLRRQPSANRNGDQP